MRRARGLSAALVTIIALSSLFITLTISAAPRMPGPPFPEVHLYVERFDQAYKLPADQIDASVFVPSWSGYALNRQPGTPLTPWAISMVAPDGSWQVPPQSGAIRFWFAPSFTSSSLGGTGPGSPATLLTLVTTNGSASLTWWSLVVSADGNSIQLQCPAADSSTPCFTAPVNFRSGGWVLLTLGQNQTSSVCWLNDQIVATGSGVPAVSAQAAPFTALVVGSDLCGQSPATGMLDLLSIFSGSTTSRRSPPTPFGLDPVWNLTAYGNSLAVTTVLGPVSDAELAARQLPRSQRTTMALDTLDNSLFPIFNTNNLPQPKPYRPTSTNDLQQVFSWPSFGTFWSLQRTNYPPLPFNPCTNCNVYIWDATNGIFLVDDLAYVYPVSTNSYEPQGPQPIDVTNYPDGTLYLTITATNAGFVTVFLHNTTNGASYTLQTTESLSGPKTNWLVEQDVIGTDGVTAVQVPVFGRQQLFFRAHTGTEAGPRVLFLQITGVSASTVNLNIYSTASGQTYEIMGSPDLTSGQWQSLGTLTGQTNWTPTTVAASGSNMFLRARSWLAENAYGIPSWWLLKYFGTTAVDPDACPMGDGWSNLEKWLYGLAPTVWCQPPAPRNFTVRLNQSNWTASLSWEACSGAVTGYTVTYWNGVNGTMINYDIGPTNSFVAPIYTPYTNLVGFPDGFSVLAHYVQGDSQIAFTSTPFPSALAPTPVVLAGSGGINLLAMKNIPSGAIEIRLTRMDLDSGYNYVGAFTNLPVSAFATGFIPFPQSIVGSGPLGPYYSLYYAQAIWSDGSVSLASGGFSLPGGPFYDGREQLKQNLAFLMRAANMDGPLQWIPYTSASAHYPTNYVFVSPVGGFPGGSLDPTWWPENYGPMLDNFSYRNLVFSTNDLWNGYLATGLDNNGELSGNLWFAGAPKYAFQPTNGITAVPGLLPANETAWIVPSDPASIGVNVTSGVFTAEPNIRNWFGLPLLSVMVTQPVGNGTDTTNVLLNIGQPTPSPTPYYSVFYPNFAQPALLTTGYCFRCRSYGGSWPLPPMPGDTAFSPLAPQFPMIAAVGSFHSIEGYAKQINLDGNAIPAYLGQYFEYALLMSNGVASATQNGVVSPYGDFLPTMPGPTALITMTNWGVNDRGTGVVYAVSLSTDVNRDGTIDPTFFGPDFTWQDRPFHFWVNDNQDSGEDGGDGISQKDRSTQDGQMIERINGIDFYKVHGVRDLIDFFPVYVNIGSLLQAIPSATTNFTFVLKERSSSLRFVYTDLTPNNFRDYLLDTNVARSLGGAEAYTIPASGIALTTSFLNKIRDHGKGILLVEAGAPTGVSWQSNPLQLEVWQGTQKLGEADLWLYITGVEQLFRHKNLIRETFPSMTSLPGTGDRLNDDEVPNEPDWNGNNFVFLHGYNVNPNQARGAFADVFKRLYWSGSHARFYGVTWRGSETQGGLHIIGTESITPNYHTNVANAFLTAPHLAHFLATLPGTNIVAAHSLGNMVVLSALSDCSAPISKYFMIDAAVATEAVQANAPQTVDMIYPDWLSYANRLYSHEWYKLFPANDARSSLTWAGRLSNFRNADVYNFYSSGEEVLRNYTGYPPPGFLSSLPETVWAAIRGASGSWAWVWQEKGKGRGASDDFVASTHGGWKFNYNPPYLYSSNGLPAFMTPSQATTTAVPDSMLQTNAFFNLTSTNFGTADLALYGPSGSTYAQANRDRMLSDTFPALTLPIGANPVPRLQSIDRNFDENDPLFRNGWPLNRTGDSGNWHHSDFREVGYTFTHRLFDDIVSFGNLE